MSTLPAAGEVLVQVLLQGADWRRSGKPFPLAFAAKFRNLIFYGQVAAHNVFRILPSSCFGFSSAIK